MNKEQAAEDDSAPVVPNFINDALPDGGVISMVVLANERINEEQADTDAAAPVAPNFLNDALPFGGGLSL